jgi:hypothetical protein
MPPPEQNLVLSPRLKSWRAVVNRSARQDPENPSRSGSFKVHAAANVRTIRAFASRDFGSRPNTKPHTPNACEANIGGAP